METIKLCRGLSITCSTSVSCIVMLVVLFVVWTRSPPAFLSPHRHGPPPHPKGAEGRAEGPAVEHLGWPRVGERPLQLEGDDHRARGLVLRGRPLLPEHPLPVGLPVQAAASAVHDEDLPPEHQRQRRHLPGHPEGPVEPGIDDQQGAAVGVLAADGPEP
jgi:hypothetical protein